MVISGLSFPKLTVYTSVQKHGKNQFTSWQRDNLTGFTLRFRLLSLYLFCFLPWCFSPS